MKYEHFGLSGPPFEFPRLPAELVLIRQYREALWVLEAGVVTEGSGFSLLVGESGTGKTVLVRALASAVLRRAYIAYIANLRVTPDAIIRLILHQLGTEPTRSSTRELWRSLDEAVAGLKPSDRVVVIIDDAQDLSDETLKSLQLFSTYNRHGSKRLHFILVACPRLLRRLESASLINFNQTIGTRTTLKPLNFDEASYYIDWLLRDKGGRAKRIFDMRALRYIITQSAGIPRRINLICHNALLAAYEEGASVVTLSNVRTALDDLPDLDNRVRTAHAQDLRESTMFGAATSAMIALGVGLVVLATIVLIPRARESFQTLIEPAAIVNRDSGGRGVPADTPNGKLFPAPPSVQPQTSKTLASADSVLPETALTAAVSANSLTPIQAQKLSYEIGRARAALGARRPNNAIYHLERGLLLEPGNSEIRHLLEIARAAQSQPSHNAVVLAASSARSVTAAGSLQSTAMPIGAPSPGTHAANLRFGRPKLPGAGISPTNRSTPSTDRSEKTPDSVAASHAISPRHVRAVRHTSFAIQIDATLDQQSADQMVSRIQRLGYHPYILSFRVGNQAWYKVEIGPYMSEDDAVTADAELRLKYNKIFGGEPTT
jgi:MSHA biogenesis protein MshM